MTEILKSYLRIKLGKTFTKKKFQCMKLHYGTSSKHTQHIYVVLADKYISFNLGLT